MRIAQVAPLTESIPPKTYGGIERVVHYLTEELVRMGHDVTLFASGDSHTSADLLAVVDESLRTSNRHMDPVYWHRQQLREVIYLAHKFDIIHFHLDTSHFDAVRQIATPAITTMHGRLDVNSLASDLTQHPDAPVVSISNAQRQPAPAANWIGTVYNGTPKENYQFQASPGNYLAFLGRISPEKGPERAIEIARRLGVPLKMAAKIDVVDRHYFDVVIQPQLDDPLIEFLGEVDEAGKNELLGGARALLFPIDWPEPFGLVMTESMACGTPVIAFRNGSVDEVLLDGVSGFIVESIDQAVEAAHRIDQIDRAKCRAYFEENFNVERMAQGYCELYGRVIEEHLTSAEGGFQTKNLSSKAQTDKALEIGTPKSSKLFQHEPSQK